MKTFYWYNLWNVFYIMIVSNNKHGTDFPFENNLERHCLIDHSGGFNGRLGKWMGGGVEWKVGWKHGWRVAMCITSIWHSFEDKKKQVAKFRNCCFDYLRKIEDVKLS